MGFGSSCYGTAEKDGIKVLLPEFAGNPKGLFEAVEEELRLRSYSPKTAKIYLGQLRAFVWFFKPRYLVQALMFIGIGIISASWVFILLSVVRAISTFIIAIPEERFCLEKYGNIYQEYMDRTPRWIGIPKSRAK